MKVSVCVEVALDSPTSEASSGGVRSELSMNTGERFRPGTCARYSTSRVSPPPGARVCGTGGATAKRNSPSVLPAPMTAEFTVTGLLQPFITLIWRVEAGQAGLTIPKSRKPGLAERQLEPVVAVMGMEI